MLIFIIIYCVCVCVCVVVFRMFVKACKAVYSGNKRGKIYMTTFQFWRLVRVVKIPSTACPPSYINAVFAAKLVCICMYVCVCVYLPVFSLIDHVCVPYH